VRLAPSSRRPAAPGLELSEAQPLPPQGGWVAACGHSQFGQKPIGVVGLVSQPRQSFQGLLGDVEVGGRLLQLALTTLPGMSGSPVVDSRGNVLGMLAKKFEEHGLAIPAAQVARAARGLELHRSWRPPVLGLELTAGGTLMCPKVMVRAVHSGGAADSAGVHKGDWLLALEGCPAASVLDVREALGSLSGAEGATVPVRLRMERAGQVFEVTLHAEVPRQERW